MGNDHALWAEVRSCISSLKELDDESVTVKADIVRRMTPLIVGLIDDGELSIPYSSVSAYIRNTLKDEGITFASSYWITLFEDEYKRKYSKSSVPNKCKHVWFVISKGWERCEYCRINRIDKVIQQAAPEEAQEPDEADEDVEAAVVEPVPDEEPEDIPEPVTIPHIDDLQIISYTNLTLLRLLEGKLAVNHRARLKEINAANTDEKRDRLMRAYDSAMELAASRLNTWTDAVKDMPDLNRIKQMQSGLFAALNDKQHVTAYESIMANVVIALGYDHNTIARLLGVVGKHIRHNVASPENAATYMQELKFLGRCPNPDCGVVLKDEVEALMHRTASDRRTTELEHAGIDPEPLQLSGYAHELVLANRRIKDLEAELAVQKEKTAAANTTIKNMRKDKKEKEW